VASDLQGDFELDLSQFDADFDWSFEAALFRRLDIAEAAYDEKDFIYRRLRQLPRFDQRCAFIKTIRNTELQDALFELIYSSR
jgi:plasmid maintenance system killer protein